MTFGEPIQLVTQAMQYNRRCDVFLILLLLLFIPTTRPGLKYIIFDGILYGMISSLLFYTKITFGLVALGLAPIMLIRRRENILLIALSATVFILIMTLVEFVYGTHFAWLTDLRMASASAVQNALNRTLHVSRDNAVEIFGLSFIPALVLLLSRRLTFSILLFCIYVTAASLILVTYSAQSYLLNLPIVFLFVALDALKPDPVEPGTTSEFHTRYVLISTLASCILVIEFYPLAVNIMTYTYRSIYGRSFG